LALGRSPGYEAIMRRRTAWTLILAASTTACGPRVSQWIQVTDCAPPHAPVHNARVYVQEMYIDDGRELPYTLGHVARGGNTNRQGMTWDSFSRDRRHVAKAVAHHTEGDPSTAEMNRQPVVRIPPNPTQPIKLCVHR
jgi:hypothetical protein